MRRDLSWRHFYHGCFARAMKVKRLLKVYRVLDDPAAEASEVP